MASSVRAMDDFCRLCAIESNSGVIIYSAEGENLCLEEKIINCLRIEISRDDMLPKRVCQSCNLLLEDYYRFSERASQVQQTLYFLLDHNLSQSHEQNTQPYLEDNDVKVESNLIKKEFDEIVINQGLINIDSEKSHVVNAEEEILRNQLECIYTRCTTTNTVENIEPIRNNFDNGINQSQRRKILVPKKNMLVKNLEGKESDKNVMNEYFHNSDYLKSQKIKKTNAVEDEHSEIELFSSDDEEENKKMEGEWKKNWGIICDQCQNIIHDRLEFEKHYRCMHNKKPVYTCSYCKKSMQGNSLYKRHIFEHICSGQFKCKFCSKKFFSKEIIRVHLENVHGQIKIRICEECGMSFHSKCRLDHHLSRHKKHAMKEYSCSDCGKVLQTRGGLAAHKSVHKLGRHFMCHICGKTFTQKINMQQHVKHHKGDKPYSCDICKKSFAEKSHLNRHKSFHTKDRPFQCPVCKKTYKTERCLKVHSQIHWNSRPYVCSFCGKGFLSSTKLKQHHNCHTGERPFACKYCERTFTNYPNWLKHTRRRHKVDHKTGLSLKEENSHVQVSSNVTSTSYENVEVSESAIEFIEMPELKEDGRDSVQPHNSILNMINPSILDGSQIEIVEDRNCPYQMNLIPELMSSQMVYTENPMMQPQNLL